MKTLCCVCVEFYFLHWKFYSLNNLKKIFCKDKLIQIMSFCRICLQPATPRTVDLDATLDAFYDELVYYDVIQHWSLTVCTYCEHLLRKAYNIRQRCRRAHILLKSWSMDKEKKVALNFLWKLLPKNPISIVNTRAVQKLFACIDKRPETGTETTIDNDEMTSLIPIDYKKESKKDIKTYYKEFIADTESLKEEAENNTNEFHPASDTENADPNKESDNESDIVFNDNFEDFFKSEVELNIDAKETDMKEFKKKKRKEKLHAKRRAMSRAMLEGFIEDGLLNDLELDKETMLNWFDRTPMSTLVLKGMLNPKYCILIEKWRELLNFLKRRFNSKYESVFEIEFLETHEQQVAEFVARQHSEQFVKAPCKCFICFKVLPRRGLMEYHNKVYHDDSLPLKCEICLCGFDNMKKMKYHMEFSHKVVYRCKRCPYVTRTREIMQLHYEEHINDGIFCKVCGKQFYKMKTMSQHMLCHKRDALCPFCGDSFALLGLNIHTRCKHKDDPLLDAQPSLSCPQCDAVFHYEDAMNNHIQRDHKEYKCSCGKEFLDDMSLTTHTKETKHIRIKSETKRAMTYVRCDVCATDVPYTSSFALRSHYRKMHPTVPYLSRDKRKNVVLCEHCGLACVVGPEYEDHLNTHSGDTPYECSECGARFATRALAEHHLKIHTKNKEQIMKSAGVKYKCHVCEKEFGNKHYLRQHITIHEDINHMVVTSRVVMPKFKVKTEKSTLTKIASDETRLKNEERSTENYGSKDSEFIESDESFHDEETSDKFKDEEISDNFKDKEISDNFKDEEISDHFKDEEISDNFKDEEIYDNYNTKQCSSGPAPGMEVIFDFENEVVEEVVLSYN